MSKISIICPSIHPEKLEKFQNSLYENTIGNNWNLITFLQPVSYPIEAFNECIKSVDSEWIWIANDDLVCETAGWDKIFLKCIEYFGSGVAMFYPNDKAFEHRFPCFPLVKYELVKELFPFPYHSYKLDDEIRDVIPIMRRYYLPHVVMRHGHVGVTGDYGFDLGEGRVYLQNSEHMKFDHERFSWPDRVALRAKLLDRNTKLLEKELASV